MSLLDILLLSIMFFCLEESSPTRERICIRKPEAVFLDYIKHANFFSPLLQLLHITISAVGDTCRFSPCMYSISYLCGYLGALQHFILLLIICGNSGVP